MSTFILLDAGPLGLATNPRASAAAEQCARWMESLSDRDVRIVVPEIADYEVRRELLRAEKLLGLQRLDQLRNTVDYLPITSECMLLAAQFWADCRKRGKPTAHDASLDADVILAAQAASLRDEGNDVVIATTNVGHLSMFIPARRWMEI
ncbi:MAG: type II toxin-antitoxin system VapC family toxin [Candidatus Acidiferrales bacterium]